MSARDIVKAAAELPISRDRDALRSWLRKQGQTAALDCAVEWLMEELRRTQRSSALIVERAASRCAEPKDAPALIDAAELSSAAEARSARLARLTARVNSEVARHQLELNSEWTPALRSQEIGLPDGTRTTWGAATAEQHEARARMFTEYATAHIEGAARHLKAAEELRAHRAACLDALLDGIAA